MAYHIVISTHTHVLLKEVDLGYNTENDFPRNYFKTLIEFVYIHIRLVIQTRNCYD